MATATRPRTTFICATCHLTTDDRLAVEYKPHRGAPIRICAMCESRIIGYGEEMLSQSDLDLYNSSDDFRRDVHYSMVGFINKLGDRAEEIQSGCFTLYLFLPEYLMVANPERATQLARMPYEWYLQSSEWNTKRDAVGMRDGHRCARCGNQHVEIHIHHKTYERRGNERLSDLVTLCAHCHAHEHEIGVN